MVGSLMGGCANGIGREHGYYQWEHHLPFKDKSRKGWERMVKVKQEKTSIGISVSKKLKAQLEEEANKLEPPLSKYIEVILKDKEARESAIERFLTSLKGGDVEEEKELEWRG